MSMTRKLGAEFLGTFWLMFGGCGSAVLAAAVPDLGIGLAGASLAFGLTVLTMAYAVGHISGGHFNPAVTLGLWAGGRFPAGQIVPYWIARVAGAIAAGVTDEAAQRTYLRNLLLATAARGRRTALVAISLLVIVGLAAILVAAWRHGTSRREALAARRARELAVRLDVQNRFLELVTESQPVGLAVLEADQGVSWVNRALSALAGSDAAGLTGKPVANAFGPLPARVIDDAARQARAGQATVESTLNLAGPKGQAVVRAQFVSFGTEPTVDRVLLVAEEVTPVVEAREKRVRLMRQLVATLVKVIDRRDPFAADHSAWVSTVAQAIAEEMELEPSIVETVTIAGQLMNLGKILVPEAPLTRGGRLTEAELGQVRESLRMGADLVAGVEFDGPVAATLRQLHERWDDQGQPDGLRGDGILLPARIIAVANAFVGMVSPRSWRAGLAVGNAVDRLMTDRGQIFDPNVVLALANRVANRAAAAEWSRIGEPVGGA